MTSFFVHLRYFPIHTVTDGASHVSLVIFPWSLRDGRDG